MNNKKILLAVLALTAFCIIGCSSTVPLPIYSFVTDGGTSATIIFIKSNEQGVRLVDCDEVPIPPPPKKTNWDPEITFPAGKPLNLRVYVFWDEDRFGERRRGIFRCPPLEAGKTYKLWFVGNAKKGSLILTDSNVSRLSYSSGKPKFDIVYEQVLPPLPK